MDGFRMGRRGALKLGGGVVAVVAGGVVGYELHSGTSTPATSTTTTTTPDQSGAEPKVIGPYVSSPDLNPTPVTFTRTTSWTPSSTSSELFVVAPKGYAADAQGQLGLMLIDGAGRLVWFEAGTPGEVKSDLQVQSYKGAPVLTFWAGQGFHGHGQGYGYIYNDHYEQIAKISAGNGLLADSHELNLTPQGTALITAYGTKTVDCTSVGGPQKGVVFYCQAQEIDIATGKMLFYWDSTDHIAVNESYTPFRGGTTDEPWDYFHMNSIALMPDGDLLISARDTWALYKVSRHTGEIVWRMNGKKSDFAMGPKTNYFWQHHARSLDATHLTVFDDGGSPPEEPSSRGLILTYDESAMTCTLERAYVHPSLLRAANQGSMQVLSDQRVVVGWGNQPYFTEFDPSGTMITDARFVPDVQSYRAFRSAWTGAPTSKPSVAARIYLASSTVYVSWNGDTRTAKWRVLAGTSESNMTADATANKTGFETVISVRSAGPFFAVQALDDKGAVLGTSETIEATVMPSATTTTTSATTTTTKPA